jgi:hypothetical protein
MLSERFTQALTYAHELHATQKRKAGDIPYITHLLGVASIALEYGANEDEAIAALLHDAIEEQRIGSFRIRNFSCIQKMKNENFHPSLFTAYCRLQEVQSYHAFTPSFFFLPPDS